jgi:hypothetical protein
MKGTAAALLTAMSQDVTTIAGCWIILRRDGTEYTFTDHQTDLVISG